MRYYIIAGERSGDLHGGNLIRALKKNDHQAEIRGFGGEYMQEAGATLAVHYAEMAVMGFGEVLTSMAKILRYIKKCKHDIVQFNPDVIILIDYGGFNRQIAKFGKKNSIRVFYYITPKVWAWNTGRAIELKKNVDRMFVILPFEKDFYKKFDWDVDYVGNPVLDAVKSHVPDPSFSSKHTIDTSKPVVALLPGSRKQELRNISPVLIDVAKRFPQVQFLVATVKNLPEDHYDGFKKLPNVKLVVEDTYNLLLHARAAIVTSGTATLETALFKVPQVVVYRASAFTVWFVKLVIKVEWISLVNLIGGKEVIKELIQRKANAEDISTELAALVKDENYRAKILQDYKEIYETLDTGSASENAARLMIHYLTSRK
jgi:lipid-A-disaccharide synthase